MSANLFDDANARFRRDLDLREDQDHEQYVPSDDEMDGDSSGEPDTASISRPGSGIANDMRPPSSTRRWAATNRVEEDVEGLFGPPGGTSTGTSVSVARNITGIAAVFNIEPSNSALITRLLAQVKKPEDEVAAVAYLMVHCLQEFTQAVAIQKAAKPFEPDTALREQAKKQSGIILLRGDLAAYSATVDASKKPILLSAICQLLLFYKGMDDDFVKTYLPPGYNGDDSGKPAKELMNFLKDILKYARSSLRTILLTGVIPVNGNPPTIPIPSLKSLVALLIRTFLDKDDMRSNDAIFGASSTSFIMRVAFLRWITIHVYRCPLPNRRQCQWQVIDRKLAELMEQPRPYQRAFFRMIQEDDSEHFNGEHTYAELTDDPEERFDIPTTAEVVAYLARHAPAQGLPDPAAELSTA